LLDIPRRRVDVLFNGEVLMEESEEDGGGVEHEVIQLGGGVQVSLLQYQVDDQLSQQLDHAYDVLLLKVLVLEEVFEAAHPQVPGEG
jgi:hypothetical protein